MNGAISILISALGGEGGGVLAGWLCEAAVDCGFPVQRTSIPGVAQRTGATTYYLEIFPTRWRDLGGKTPILGLHPCEGRVDMIVATELLEASRALHRGYGSKDRTLLIASTHRVFTIAEKAAATQGIFNERTAFEAIDALTRKTVLFDGEAAAKHSRSQINAVLLGAIAGSGRLPMPPDAFRAAMRRQGKAVDDNLRGFEIGLRAATGAADPIIGPATAARDDERPVPAWVRRAREATPAVVWPIVREGMARLVNYQDERYARLYVDRLLPFRALDRSPHALLESVARQLALWMSYEDVVRVAQLKTKPARLQRLRAAHGAGNEQPIVVVDYLKPGPIELCGLLPSWLGRPLMQVIEHRGWQQKLSVPLRVRTSSVAGFTLMRLLASLRPWRRHSYGFRLEQESIDGWLARVHAAASKDLRFAREIAQCAQLVRGYADTRERGYARLRRIFDAVVDPLLEGNHAFDPADAVRRARTSVAKDDTGVALEAQISGLWARPVESVTKPVLVLEKAHVDGR